MAGRIALVASSALAAAVSAQAPVPMTTCTYPLMDFSGTNTIATWDFTAAFNASADYNWQDRNDFYVKNYTYTFQVRARECRGGRWLAHSAYAPTTHNM